MGQEQENIFNASLVNNSQTETRLETQRYFLLIWDKKTKKPQHILFLNDLNE